MFIFNLLQKYDVEVHGTNKTLESIELSRIGYSVDVYCGNVIRSIIHGEIYVLISSSFEKSLRSFRGFLPGGRLRALLTYIEVDSSVSFSMPSGDAGLRVLVPHPRAFSSALSVELGGGSGGKSASERCFGVLFVVVDAGGGIALADDSGIGFVGV